MDSLKKRRRSSRQIFKETVITVFQFDEKMDTIRPGNSTSTKTRNVKTTIPRHITDYSKTMDKEQILKPSNPSSPQKDILYTVKRIDVGKTPDFSWAKMQVRLQPPQYTQLYNGIV